MTHPMALVGKHCTWSCDALATFSSSQLREQHLCLLFGESFGHLGFVKCHPVHRVKILHTSLVDGFVFWLEAVADGSRVAQEDVLICRCVIKPAAGIKYVLLTYYIEMAAFVNPPGWSNWRLVADDLLN